MNQYWTSHLTTDEEKERFVSQLHGARSVLVRLHQLIHMQEMENAKSERSVKAYDSPSWPFLQAHRNGYASAMNTIKNLITLDHQNEHPRQQ